MILALGEFEMATIVDGLLHMAQDKGGVTTDILPKLTDEETKEMFRTRGTKHQNGGSVAHLQNGEFIINKTLLPVFEDPAFHTFKNIKTNMALLHARFRTIGRDVLQNIQPFQHQEFIFCHNGTIRKEIKYDTTIFPRAETDSERLLYSILSKRIPFEKAIPKTFQEISLKPNSNIILTSKENTYVYSSQRTIPDYLQMYIGKDGKSLVVSSERIPHPNISWEKLPFEKVMVINNTTREVKFV